eukprot:GHVS01046068.1.p1 GENE.GHVS01046068.1~~GHVS01046068.1.p1  ORF type:complete len:261 (+),score=38.04 GHVS01046068.1:69-785(+)
MSQNIRFEATFRLGMHKPDLLSLLQQSRLPLLRLGEVMLCGYLFTLVIEPVTSPEEQAHTCFALVIEAAMKLPPSWSVAAASGHIKMIFEKDDTIFFATNIPKLTLYPTGLTGSSHVHHAQPNLCRQPKEPLMFTICVEKVMNHRTNWDAINLFVGLSLDGLCVAHPAAEELVNSEHQSPTTKFKFEDGKTLSCSSDILASRSSVNTQQHPFSDNVCVCAAVGVWSGVSTGLQRLPGL